MRLAEGDWLRQLLNHLYANEPGCQVPEGSWLEKLNPNLSPLSGGEEKKIIIFLN